METVKNYEEENYYIVYLGNNFKLIKVEFLKIFKKFEDNIQYCIERYFKDASPDELFLIAEKIDENITYSPSGLTKYKNKNCQFTVIPFPENSHGKEEINYKGWKLYLNDNQIFKNKVKGFFSIKDSSGDIRQYEIDKFGKQFLMYALKIFFRLSHTKLKWDDERNKSSSQNIKQDDFNSFVGLSKVKEELNKLVNLYHVNKLRKLHSLTPISINLHSVFTGNPGTGKTTVARFYAQKLYEIGFLRKGHLVEVDREGLISQYVGETAIKTKRVCKRALDGVLFIDEAYSLVNCDDKDLCSYGYEAISTLLKFMEDYRDRIVIIVAGYPKEMHNFIQTNPGLASRFNNYIHFEDYSEEELVEIFKFLCHKNEYEFDNKAISKVKEIIQHAKNYSHNFSNARFVRNLFEIIIKNQANRIAYMDSITTQMLKQIDSYDVEIAKESIVI